MRLFYGLFLDAQITSQLCSEGYRCSKCVLRIHTTEDDDLSKRDPSVFTLKICYIRFGSSLLFQFSKKRVYFFSRQLLHTRMKIIYLYYDSIFSTFERYYERILSTPLPPDPGTKRFGFVSNRLYPIYVYRKRQSAGIFISWLQ